MSARSNRSAQSGRRHRRRDAAIARARAGKPLTRAAISAPSTPGLVWTVARREIVTQARSRAFIVSVAILLVAVFGGIVIVGLVSQGDLGGASEPDRVGVVGDVAGLPDALAYDDGWDFVALASADEARQAVLDGDVVCVIVEPDPGTGAVSQTGTSGWTVIGLEEAPDGIVAGLTLNPAVVLLDPPPTTFMFRYFISLIFGVLFLWMAMLFGQTTAQNTVVEKQTRVVEILLAAVPARVLMAGKVVGNSVLALAQTMAMAVAAMAALAITGQTEYFDLLTAPVLWYVVFFAVGFVLLASMFAASAALVSRMEDVGSATMPVIMLVMLPYMLVISLNSNTTAMAIMSYVPFVSPVAMPVRMVIGEAVWWEALISLAFLAVTAGVAILIAGRIYAGSVLRTGPRIHIREALKASSR